MRVVINTYVHIWVVTSGPADRQRSAVRGQVLEAARALEARGFKPNRKNVEREMQRRDVAIFKWFLEQTPSEHARDQFVSRVLRDVRRVDRADARAREAEAARAKAVELAGAERMVHFVTNVMRDEQDKRRSRLLRLRVSLASLTAALGVSLVFVPVFFFYPAPTPPALIQAILVALVLSSGALTGSLLPTAQGSGSLRQWARRNPGAGDPPPS